MQTKRQTEFWRWLSENGVKRPEGFSFREDALTGPGIFTDSELPAGTAAIDVPSSLAITSVVAREAMHDLVKASRMDTGLLLKGLEDLSQHDTVVLLLVLARKILELQDSLGQSR